MSERKDWRRAIGKNNLLDETVEIDLIFRETAHTQPLRRSGNARSDIPCPRQSNVASSDLTRRDRTRRLGREDSNLCISESDPLVLVIA